MLHSIAEVEGRNLKFEISQQFDNVVEKFRLCLVNIFLNSFLSFKTKKTEKHARKLENKKQIFS